MPVLHLCTKAELCSCIHPIDMKVVPEVSTDIKVKLAHLI